MNQKKCCSCTKLKSNANNELESEIPSKNCERSEIDKGESKFEDFISNIQCKNPRLFLIKWTVCLNLESHKIANFKIENAFGSRKFNLELFPAAISTDVYKLKKRSKSSAFNLVMVPSEEESRDSEYMFENLDQDLDKTKKKDETFLKPKFVWVTCAKREAENLIEMQSGEWLHSYLNIDLLTENGVTIIELWIDVGESIPGRKRVSENLVNRFENQSSCDVTFVFEDGRTLGAHAAILAAASPMFNKTYLPFHSFKSSSKTLNIKVQNVEYDILKTVLHFLCAGKIKENDFLNNQQALQKVYDVASQYHIQPLKKESVAMLKENLESYNVTQILKWAYEHSIDSLFEASIDLVIEHNTRSNCPPDDEWRRFEADSPELFTEITNRIAKKLAFHKRTN